MMDPCEAVATAHHEKRARLLAQPVERDLSQSPPNVLRDTIALLRAPGEVDLAAVMIAMQTVSLDTNALGDAVCADPTAYVRTLLHRDERAELLALTWMPRQRSPLHDHGASTCIVRVVAGQAEEHLYRPRGRGESRRPYMRRSLVPGVVTRSPGKVAHTLGNASSEVLVTLHCYSPPLKRD